MKSLGVSLLFVFLLIPPFLDAEQAHAQDGVSQSESSWFSSFKIKARKNWTEVKSRISNWWSDKFGEEQTEKAEVAQPDSNNAKASSLPPHSKQSVEARESVPEHKQKPIGFAKSSGYNADSVRGKARNLRASQAMATSRAARAGTSQLPKTRKGVPYFSLYRKKKVKDKNGNIRVVRVPVRKIPQLDIGNEAAVSRSQFDTPEFLGSDLSYDDPQAIPSPKMLGKKRLEEEVRKSIVAASGPEKKLLEDVKKLKDQLVTQKKIDAVAWKISGDAEVQEKPVNPLKAEDLQMLVAILLYKQDKCHLAAGFFHELTVRKKYGNEADYYLASCANKMGLFTDYYSRLIRMIDAQDPEYLPLSIAAIPEKVPYEFEIELAQKIKKMPNQSYIPKEAGDKINFLITRSSFRQAHPNTAIKYANLIPANHSNYHEAQYIKGMSQHSLGKKKQAFSTLQSLQQPLVEGKLEKNLKSLVSVDTGRMLFHNKKYKEAMKSYVAVEKDHPLWIDALLEQGWTQILQGDFSGAIGNMYSVQSPYFKAVYKPDSYVIRTIGYLNICQYGDAYRTLTGLEKQYRPWLENMRNYQSNNKLAKQYYSTVAKYLSGKSTTSVDGLPYQVIREMARHPDFLNNQDAVNHRVDEMEQYKFLVNYIRKDRNKVKWLRKKAKQRIASIKEKIAKARQNGTLEKNINQWNADIRNEKERVFVYNFQLEMFARGKNAFKKYQRATRNAIKRRKKVSKIQAERALARRLHMMIRDLTLILDNNELLRYEVFSGSGENIRFLAGGGEKQKRVPASVKPSNLKWDFAGEYWADEIGHYRSSLQNNCPEFGRQAQTGDRRKRK